MAISENSIVGTIVADNYRTADVFKKHGIDFCCGGNISLSEAASQASTDTKALLHELESATAEKDLESDLLQRIELDELASLIVERHHSFIRENLVSIPPYLTKLADVHGANHPELLEVKVLFRQAAEALSSHINKEEQILFPRIKELVEANKKGIAAPRSHFGSIENPIRAMHGEHDDEGERFRTISALTNSYTVPADGCTTYRVGLAKLKAFEDDLHRHIHLENNILFPKAIELEKKSVF